MAEKRFNVFDVDGIIFLEDHQEGSYHIGEIGNVDVNCLKEIAYRLNELAEENQDLKKENKKLKEKYDAQRLLFGQLNSDYNNLREENKELKQLNIPIEEIKETVTDYQGRITAIYYKE